MHWLVQSKYQSAPATLGTEYATFCWPGQTENVPVNAPGCVGCAFTVIHFVAEVKQATLAAMQIDPVVNPAGNVTSTVRSNAVYGVGLPWTISGRASPCIGVGSCYSCSCICFNIGRTGNNRT